MSHFRRPDDRQRVRTGGAVTAAIEELLCAAAAAGSRDAVIKVLTDHLADLTGADQVCVWRAAGAGTEILAGEPSGPADADEAGVLQVVQAATLTATLRGGDALGFGLRRDIERVLRWADAAVRLLDVAA